MAVALACQLGPVPDQETGIAGEFIGALRDDLDDEFVGDDFSAGRQSFIKSVGFVQFGDDTFGIRRVGGLQILQGPFLGFLDVGSDFVVVGCH